MRSPIVVVAAEKGGVGKTTLAVELAAVLEGIVVDLDFHAGGATSRLGLQELRDAPLVRALAAGPSARAPEVRRRAGRPGLVSSTRRLGRLLMDQQDMAECLEAWAAAWGGPPVVVDTHPGAHWTTDGALMRADLLIVPLPPGELEAAATAGMLAEHGRIATVVVPVMVPRVPPAAFLAALEDLVERFGVRVGPPVSEHRWLRRRRLRTAVTLQANAGARTRAAAAEFRAVASHIADVLREIDRERAAA
jgi:chromosome partitioning protein